MMIGIGISIIIVYDIDIIYDYIIFHTYAIKLNLEANLLGSILVLNVGYFNTLFTHALKRGLLPCLQMRTVLSAYLLLFLAL